MASESGRVVARSSARPETVEELKTLLRRLVEPTRREKSCVSYQLLQNKADPTDFTFVEEWKNDAAIDAHFATLHVKEALAKVVSLVAKEPDIRRYEAIG